MNHATMKTTKNKNTNNNHNKNEHVIEYIKDCNEIVAREWERERERNEKQNLQSERVRSTIWD